MLPYWSKEIRYLWVTHLTPWISLPAAQVHIARVLKNVHPDRSASAGALSIMISLTEDVCENIASEAAMLVRITNRVTMTSRDIQYAVRLVLPGELAKHAIAEGTKAVTKYNKAIDKAPVSQVQL